MRRYTTRRFSRPRRKVTRSVTHIPSAMSNAPGANTATVIIPAVASRLAGLAVTGNVSDEDRDRECPPGVRINNIVFDIGVRNTDVSGVLEYCILKVERANVTPALGTLLPTSASILSVGLQQAVRQEQPGRVVKFGQIAYTAGTTRAISVKANYAKFKMATVRAGDHYILITFNRTSSGSTIFDVQMRYKTLQ